MWFSNEMLFSNVLFLDMTIDVVKNTNGSGDRNCIEFMLLYMPLFLYE